MEVEVGNHSDVRHSWASHVLRSFEPKVRAVGRNNYYFLSYNIIFANGNPGQKDAVPGVFSALRDDGHLIKCIRLSAYETTKRQIIEFLTLPVSLFETDYIKEL